MITARYIRNQDVRSIDFATENRASTCHLYPKKGGFCELLTAVDNFLTCFIYNIVSRFLIPFFGKFSQTIRIEFANNKINNSDNKITNFTGKISNSDNKITNFTNKILSTELKILSTEHKILSTEHKIDDFYFKIGDSEFKIGDSEVKICSTGGEINYIKSYKTIL
jgi:hypothetical protein